MATFFFRSALAVFLTLFFSTASNQGNAEEKPSDSGNSEATESIQEETTPRDAGTQYTPRTFHVTIPNWDEKGSYNFKPTELTVKVGDIIVWTNNDTRTHFVTSMKNNYPQRDYSKPTNDEEEEEEEEEESDEAVDDTFFSSSDIEPGDTFTHSFKKPGVYKYFCFRHPRFMQGFIIVEE
jgi:plastocyanin